VHRRLSILAVAAALVWSARAIPAQEARPAPPEEHHAREASFSAGVVLAPREIGRDMNAAGGDTLVAHLGTGPITGGRFEARNRLAGVGGSMAAWLKPVTVRNAAGVDFPHHGTKPVLLTLEARLYPLGRTSVGRLAAPYVSVGAGGLLVSVDLDNIDDQELRLLWQRGLGAGLRMALGPDGTFIDVGVARWFISGRRPLAAFEATALVVGLGTRFR
jgi:hypothetical protein